MNDQKKALNFYQQSLALRQEIGFKPFIPASYFSLGLVYANLGMQELAIEAFTKSIEHATEIQFVRYQCDPYLNLGNLFLSKKNIKKAREYYSKALNIATLHNYSKGIDAASKKLNGL